MRCLLPLTLVTSLIVSAPQSAAAQVSGSESEVGVTVFAAAGSGPAGSAAWGLNAEVPLYRGLSLKAEYSQWSSGFGGCIQTWPESYACSVDGWAGLTGLSLHSPAIGWLRPYAEALGGIHVRDQLGEAYRAATMALGVGTDIRLGSRVSLRAGARLMQPFDDGYEELMGESLRYTVGTVGLRYGIPW